MSSSVATIPLLNLSLTLIPVFALIFILHRWSLDSKYVSYGVLRMVIQLLFIGYLLTFIFEANNGWIIGMVLIVMIMAASWIALGNVADRRLELYVYAVFSITVAGGCTLILVTQLVLSIQTWYSPQQVVPLAGMIFAASMNSISLAAERIGSEMERGVSYIEAKAVALNAALIPITNSLFAVGLVSLPGMMTAQILSGVSPFIAAGFSAVLFLVSARPLLLRAKVADE